MATHSSVLAWWIPGTGEPGGLPSMGSHRVRHDWSDLAAAAAAAVGIDHILWFYGCFQPSEPFCYIQRISRLTGPIFFPKGEHWLACCLTHTHDLININQAHLHVCMLRCFTVACQAPLSMGFSRQEYQSGLPCPFAGDLPKSRDWTCVSCVFCIGRRILYH